MNKVVDLELSKPYKFCKYCGAPMELIEKRFDDGYNQSTGERQFQIQYVFRCTKHKWLHEAGWIKKWFGGWHYFKNGVL